MLNYFYKLNKYIFNVIIENKYKLFFIFFFFFLSLITYYILENKCICILGVEVIYVILILITLFMLSIFFYNKKLNNINNIIIFLLLLSFILFIFFAYFYILFINATMHSEIYRNELLNITILKTKWTIEELTPIYYRYSIDMNLNLSNDLIRETINNSNSPEELKTNLIKIKKNKIEMALNEDGFMNLIYKNLPLIIIIAGAAISICCICVYLYMPISPTVAISNTETITFLQTQVKNNENISISNNIGIQNLEKEILEINNKLSGIIVNETKNTTISEIQVQLSEIDKKFIENKIFLNKFVADFGEQSQDINVLTSYVNKNITNLTLRTDNIEDAIDSIFEDNAKITKDIVDNKLAGVNKKIGQIYDNLLRKKK